MLKTYIAGVVLGVAATVAALLHFPAVDLEREISLITVTPNGGNAEAFHVNLPGDRIMLGAAGEASPVPASLAWPADGSVGGFDVELFKLRNARDVVVGVASRISAGDHTAEWVLHLPARGSMYALLENVAGPAERRGPLRAGTREFAELSGSLAERRVTANDPDPERAEGRLELVATYLAAARAEVAP